MNNPFSNFDFSLRAINGLQASGYDDMDDVLIIIQNNGMPYFLDSLTRCSKRTEQGFMEPEPEENMPESYEYNHRD